MHCLHCLHCLSKNRKLCNIGIGKELHAGHHWYLAYHPLLLNFFLLPASTMRKKNPGIYSLHYGLWQACFDLSLNEHAGFPRQSHTNMNRSLATCNKHNIATSSGKCVSRFCEKIDKLLQLEQQWHHFSGSDTKSQLLKSWNQERCMLSDWKQIKPPTHLKSLWVDFQPKIASTYFMHRICFPMLCMTIKSFIRMLVRSVQWPNFLDRAFF